MTTDPAQLAPSSGPKVIELRGMDRMGLIDP